MESDPDSESGENTTFPKKETTLGRTQEVPPNHEDVTPPPPVSDVLGRLTTTLQQLSAVTGLSRNVELPRYDGSYEAQSFFTNYDAQADRAQLQYSTRLRKPPNLLQAPFRVTNTRACELRSVIRFLAAKKNSAKDIHTELCQVYGEGCMNSGMVRRWVREFKNGRTDVHDEPRAGRPSVSDDGYRLLGPKGPIVVRLFASGYNNQFRPVTFFGGCLALSGFAEHKNLHSITFKPVLTRQAAAHKGLLYRMLCAGGGSGSGDQHELMEWFRTYVGTALTRKPVKALVLVLFAVYLAVAGLGLSRMQEGLKISDLYSYDSYARAYVQAQYRYFNNYRFRIQILVNHTFDYSNPKDQGIVEDTLKRLEAGPFVASPMLTESWLRVYLWFLKEPKLYFARRSCNLETKEGFYRCLRNSFFKLPQARRFQNDVVFNDNYTDIIASRFIIQTHNWTSSDEIKQMILTFRGLVDDLPFQVTVFNQYFVFIDQYVVIRDYTTQSILATAILMNIITFLFIPKFTCAIWVGFSIVSIQIGLIGYSSLWGINLNAISMMTYVMCIGFSVDNAAHVTYAYVSVKKDNPNDKIKEALFWVGLPVVQGSATTIIGIIVLALAPAYVYVVIFKTVFLVMLFSALHSIFLLPVLLSLFDSFFSRKPSDVKTVPPPEREIMLASVEKTPAITNGF
ncbi:daf-6 [Cordylochernes scorpioides]|uniref:Daf-6 n=1 Tax=Cordylochernes scorpioides TaxID=51811 RepID=A0ABY6KB94_9ARAC|nr:daf-6 [Cordylochernes scorpioides]